MEMEYYKQKIECCVRNCKYYKDDNVCGLSKILVTNDIINEDSKYNTMCQSFSEK